MNSENETSSDDDSEDDCGSEDSEQEIEDFTWLNVPENFVPLKQMPTRQEPENSVKESDTRTDIFFKLFPKSLFMLICEYTNKR